MKYKICKHCHCIIPQRAHICRICGSDQVFQISYKNLNTKIGSILNKIEIGLFVIIVVGFIIYIASSKLKILLILASILLFLLIIGLEPVIQMYLKYIENIRKEAILKIVSNPPLSLINVILPDDLEMNSFEGIMQGTSNKTKIIEKEQRTFKLITLYKIVMANIVKIINLDKENVWQMKALRESLNFLNKYKDELELLIGRNDLLEITNLINKYWLVKLFNKHQENLIEPKLSEILFFIEKYTERLDLIEAYCDTEKI